MFRILKKNIETGKVTLPYAALTAKAPEGPRSYGPSPTRRVEGLGEKGPEGFLGAPEVDPTKCTGCGKCVAVCPTPALTAEDHEAEDKRSFRLFYGSCIFCGLCGPACPHQAISFKGKFGLAARTKKELNQELSFSLPHITI